MGWFALHSTLPWLHCHVLMLLHASWELHGDRVCLGVSLKLQVPEHPAAGSIPSSHQPHLDGHGNPRWSVMPRGGGWQHCQSQQTLSNCSFSAASSAPQIEVIVPGVRSIKLNSPKFNQFDKQWYSKATAAASKSHFSSLLRDLLWGAASQCHPSSSGDTVRGKAQDWIYLSSSSLDSGQRYHSSEKPSQPLHIANNGSWWGTAGSAHVWDSCEWRGHLSLTSCFNLKGRLGKWYKNEQGEASYACFAHFAVKCRNTQNKFNGRNSDWRLCVLSAGYNAIISLCAFVCAGEHEGAPAISASPKDHLRIQSTSIFLFFFFGNPCLQISLDWILFIYSLPNIQTCACM